MEAFQTMTRNGAQAVLIGNIGEHFANRRLIVELATRHRLPTMAPGREFVDVGSLMAYGVSYPDNWRRAATYVDKILKGAKPADLPDRAAHQVRARHQPQDRQGPRPHDPAVGAGAGG